ncbi:MAG: FtsH protease activity modulator HflK, partial [Gammaproteobacteria bacterium]|nr:FtsH protease activity modulator HflK [Gammaproteobacteria bacterium]
VAVQYRISNAKDYLYNVVDPTTSLQQATASALRQVIGNTTLDDILTTGRAVVRDQVAVQLQNILSLYNAGITISDVALQPAKAPEQVKDAFDDAINAQEDEQRFENQAEAYAMGIVPIAQGHAQRISQEAQAYQQQVVLQAQADVARFLAVLPVYESAPVVTRERLYLTTLQDIFTRSNKVFLDTKQGSNFYLPLNQWPTANKTPVMNQASIDDMTSSLAKTGDLSTSNADTSNRPDRFSNNPDGQIGDGDQS